MKNNLSGRVLVTGSAGYIGTALCNRLEKNNINYLGVDKIADVSPFHHCLDLSREEETHKLLNDYNPEIIYHCGTYSAGDYQRDFLKSYESDSKSLINILSFIRNKGNKIKLIFFSSSYVYEGCDGGASVSESCIINSSNNSSLVLSNDSPIIK